MSSRPVPQLPNYRITLFYGPEPEEGRPGIQTCVFNVKKRSWKAGIQVAIELSEAQLDRARAHLKFREWLDSLPASVDRRRADELFVQAVSMLKLDLVIEAGLSQENQRVDAQTLLPQLDERLTKVADQIKSQIVTELDLEA
jgi:hypothetical protein